MTSTARAALASLVFCVACGRACAAPKPAAEDPTPDIDAAPSSGEVPPRCGLEREVAIEGTDVELGRMTLHGTRALVGARHDGRAAIAEFELARPATVRFVDLAGAAGEIPPPMPLVVKDKVFAVGYESAASKRLRLVLRDVAAPSAVAAELPPEPPDDSLAFDAFEFSGGALVAWDAPADEGSAVFVASFALGTKPSEPVRVSPAGTDADTPRFAHGPAGPIVLFEAHRALPKLDAAALLEGPGQDPEHVWVAMQPLGTDGRPAGPMSSLTAESGSVAAYEVVPIAIDPQGESAGVPSARRPNGAADFDVVARDGIELGAGQGGRLDRVTVRNGVPAASVAVADHVGRGAAALLQGPPAMLLFSDATERGRSSLLGDSPPAFEPALDGARPLGALPESEVGALRILAVATAAGSERASLRVLKCTAR